MSNAFPINTNARPVIAIIIPGGAIHHHSPLAAAPYVFASCNICPHVGNVGSPKPKKLIPASVVIAAGTEIAILANAYGAAARGLWWWIAPPGIMIAITGLAFVFIGNALDAIVNPKLKK